MNYCLWGIAQWIKHLPGTQAAGVQSRTRPEIFSAPILSGTPAMCTLSHTQFMLTSAPSKKRGIIVNSQQHHLWGRNTVIRVMYGWKGAKNTCKLFISIRTRRLALLELQTAISAGVQKPRYGPIGPKFWSFEILSNNVMLNQTIRCFIYNCSKYWVG